MHRIRNDHSDIHTYLIRDRNHCRYHRPYPSGLPDERDQHERDRGNEPVLYRIIRAGPQAGGLRALPKAWSYQLPDSRGGTDSHL